MSLLSWLDREHIVAPPGFNRWLVPPAALCVHLCIGQVYAFSVFNGPMSKLLGIAHAAAPKAGTPISQVIAHAPAAAGDWRLTQLGWIFTIAILVLGIASALTGSWLDRVGPRKAMFAAAITFGGGFLVSALGVHLHQLWLVYLGYGVFGGIGIGIGYISPVKTLITWFPDRPGLSTGLAIMGFGGGAMIASPLSFMLMNAFSTPTHVGVAETFVVMGLIYFVFTAVGGIIVRVPAPGWAPAGYVAPLQAAKRITVENVHVDQALKTPQFYLLWWVLCLNVTAGIGVLSQASKMSQEMLGVTPAAAAGFVGLLSLFNMGGRFVWASASDYIGRRNTYFVFFLLGILLYAVVPTSAHIGSVALFVLCYLIIISMYGGGFATIPAYLKDIFGVRYVGAIHGRLLTAWSAAGVFGPVLVNYIRQYQIDHGVAKADAYTVTMYIMAGLLFIGFLCNCFISRVHERHYLGLQESQA